jgi:hypothetical protein
MRSTTRLVAAASGGLLLAAVVATPALAHSGESDGSGTHSPSGHGMAQMHEQMMSENPGMGQMHEQTMAEDPDMAQMHEGMMASSGAAHSACDQS